MMNKKEYISPKISPVIIDKEIVVICMSRELPPPSPSEDRRGDGNPNARATEPFSSSRVFPESPVFDN